ncbi:MaoC/PaaZ C-terminal domain-containing protein [Haloprofundus sp. MHR1]|uniref:MaoC/PaaZ C-terminal domain-containing protein n=1 Tax=Haloprofundus sp. MHR1 TaxID=2572921 RepID=UPI0010BE21D6|nr:MaoC/PaaZ C-terminal domain-containing protein [Haloprofundus sp. MHR1]QCJ47103.1 monoamine oxidase [Haloprofundus sp. MHR1]
MSGPVRYYDDLSVGDTFETRGRTITETHLVTHAGNTGDMNELQMNAAYAADTEFGERPVHAPLTYSVMEGLITSDFRNEASNVCYYGLNSMRIPAPTFVGDTVSVNREIVDKRDKSPGGIVAFRDEVTTDDGRTVLVCETLEYIRSRPEGK